jgi:hypothetical protein
MLRATAMLQEAREGVACAVANRGAGGLLALAFAVRFRTRVRTGCVAGLRVLGAFAQRLCFV